MAEFAVPTHFRPTLPPRSKGQALREGLANALPYAATWPLMATDVVESGLDKLRGTRSPNRMTQAASALKQLFGGDAIPQEYERGVEPWDVAKYDIAGSLPAAQLSPLRAASAVPAALRHGAESFAHSMAGAMPAVVKGKGGNWLSGSVENALSGLKKAGTSPGSPYEGLNSWIEGPLTKYVKTRMASPEDEVRKLAEQGVLHYEPNDLYSSFHKEHRAAAGMPTEGVGVSQLAKDYENITDGLVRPNSAASWRTGASPDTLSKIPGIAKIPDNEMIHELSNRAGAAEKLGFNHLIDELSNALNPASGLPRNLLLTPEAVQNMSMEKAVRRVADINAYRAAQKVEANRKLAEQASLVREYAENNPKGLRWVQLKAKESDLPWPQSGTHPDDTAKELRDQLKYEGDTMGNCVGGYCDDVLSGRSQIYSLRDAKGEPHVTVEVAPSEQRPKDVATIYEKVYGHQAPNDQEELMTFMDSPEYANHLKSSPPSLVISQIKGKGNKKPNDEYLPFVQDFVKNPHTGQPWSDVGDLQNTGLIDIRKFPKRVEALGGPYTTEAELNKYLDSFPPGQQIEPPEGFAQGGIVQTEQPNPWSAAFKQG